jgi:hypothetical protein
MKRGRVAGRMREEGICERCGILQRTLLHQLADTREFQRFVGRSRDSVKRIRRRNASGAALAA